MTATPAPPVAERRTRRRGTTLVVVAVTLVAAGVLTAWQVRPTTDRPGAAASPPTEVTSDAPRFATLEDMAAASDAVVLAEVVAEADGRTITDPADPERGVRTRLLELEVVEVLVGAVPRPLVLEEEAMLLDGTPVRVDGVAPAGPGDRGVFFLVAGGSDANPHHALVGPQGRFLVDGDDLVPATSSPLGAIWVAAGGPALADAIRATETVAGG